MPKVKKILVPIDFSEESGKALRYAASLAKEMGAELMALHVIEEKRNENDFLSSLAALEDWSFHSIEPRALPVDVMLRERALDLWNFIEGNVRQNGHVKITRKVALGSLIKEMAVIAREENVDLIVLEIRKRFLRFNLATLKLFKIIGKLPCPVLLAPPIPEDGREPRRPVGWLHTMPGKNVA